jgi:hypothetical protein
MFGIKLRPDKLKWMQTMLNEIRLYNAQERARKQKEDELNEWAMIIGACSFVLFIMFIGGYELFQFCQTGNRCGR